LVGLVSSRRVAIVTAQLLGFDASGGVGAATASLAIALARRGHQVECLYIKERLPQPLDPEWAQQYEEAGVALRHVPAYHAAVEPNVFRRMRAVELALRDNTPDVVIAHEYGAPAYIAQRLRRLGLAFERTLFVTYCHGTGPWVKDVTGNPRVAPEMLTNARLEQMGVELADVVVSPSAYLIRWMQERGWRVPAAARVIPLVTRATALGETVSSDVEAGARVQRVAYFGRLEERKGIAPFVGALNTLEPHLLAAIDVEFVGNPSKNWDQARVTAELSERTHSALRSVSFATELGREAALARLKRPGTLAVMPSLAENSPNVVYECLETRIPFLASDRGGIGELVAPEDRARVLFEPTAEGIAAALRRALAADDALRPARPAFNGAEVVGAWEDVVSTNAQPAPVVEATALDEGEWVVALDEGDLPAPELVETLVRAQAASGADVVTCGLVHEGTEHYFLGEPGGVGVLANHYGTAALIRRALLDDPPAAMWPLLAQLDAAGTHIVSVPLTLLTAGRAPATLDSDPEDALRVVEALERTLPDHARLLARLAAGLAARPGDVAPAGEPPVRRLARRVLRRDA
jgi:glycosyltransferase involved in cell wall biosynthesis